MPLVCLARRTLSQEVAHECMPSLLRFGLCFHPLFQRRPDVARFFKFLLPCCLVYEFRVNPSDKEAEANDGPHVPCLTG